MVPPGISRKEVIAWAIISVGILIYLFLRAAWVPIVHDEGATFLHYILSGEFLPGIAHWDAANHVLNSGLSIFSVQLFGEGKLAMRLPSVLAYPIYALGALWVASWCRDKLVSWSVLLALLLCPFLLDFFALCRGYGLGMAFFLACVAAACSCAERPTKRSLVILFWSSAAAIWADLALIPALALLLATTVFFIALRPEKRMLLHWSVLISGVCAAILWSLGIYHAHQLSEKGLLYHGSRGGFIEVTLQPLFQFVVGTQSLVLIAAVLIVAFILVGLALVKDRSPSSFSILALNLVLLVLGTVILAIGFHINYPEDRAALQFIVLFIVLIGFAVDRLNQNWRWAALLLLFLPARTVLLANMGHTLLWSEQSLPSELLDVAQAQQKASERPVTLGAYHQHALVWAYADRQRDDALPQLIPFHDPDTIADLMLVDDRFTEKLSSAYRPIAGAYHDGLTLFQRNPVLSRWPVFSRSMPDMQTNSEFIDLPKPGLEELYGKPLLIRFQATANTSNEAAIQYVASADWGEHSDQYHSQALIMIEDQNGSKEVDITLMMTPLGKHVERIGFYLWNPEQRQIELHNGVITITALHDP